MSHIYMGTTGSEKRATLSGLGTAQQLFQAAAEGVTSGAVEALRRTLPPGLRPASPSSARVRVHLGAPASAFSCNDSSTKGTGSSFIFASPDDPSTRSESETTVESSTSRKVDEQAAMQGTRKQGSGSSPTNQSHSRSGRLYSLSCSQSDESLSEVLPPARDSHIEALLRELVREAETNDGELHYHSESVIHESFSIQVPLDHIESGLEPLHRESSGSLSSEMAGVSACNLPSQISSILVKAQRWAAEHKFAEALTLCLTALTGPSEVLELIRILCAAWQDSYHLQNKASEEDFSALPSDMSSSRNSPDTWRLLLEKEREVSNEIKKREAAQWRLQEQEAEMKSILSELRASQQRAEQWRRLKEEKDIELLDQIRRREDAEREAGFLRQTSFLHDCTKRENAMLKQQLRDAEAAYFASASLVNKPEVLAKQVAAFECSPLRQCTSDARQALKKRLLVKWHPDKQPSAAHVSLATQVMQALQNTPEWHL